MSNKHPGAHPDELGGADSAGTDRGPDGDLASQKREFIDTFFKRGAEFAEELMYENERLRFRVLELEEQQRSARSGAEPLPAVRDLSELNPDELRDRLLVLEREREEIMRRVRGVEALNKDYLSRYQEIERENNNLANLYVASHQLHSTLELRELTQIIVEILLNFIGAKTFAIQLVDEERHVLRTLASEGIEKARVPERHTSTQVAELMTGGGAFFSSGPMGARPVTSPPAVGVPLKIGNKVVGLILVWELLAQKTGLVDVDFELFNLLGDHAGSALQSAKLNAELEGRPPALWVAADLV